MTEQPTNTAKKKKSTKKICIKHYVEEEDEASK